MENNEPEPEPIETSPTTPSSTVVAPTPVVVAATPEPPKSIKNEIIEPIASTTTTTTTITTVASTVPVITSTKVISTEPMPLNVSIRLPDDMNERKNLIKRNLVEFNAAEVKKEPVKSENSGGSNSSIKTEKESVKDEVKEIPEKFKTELIIPKVVAVEKPMIKEEVVDCSGESVKEDVTVVGYGGVKEVPVPPPPPPPPVPSAPSHHYPLNLKDTKEQVLNLNVYNPYGAQNKEHTVIKLEPRDEPMELTNSSNRSEVYSVNQPLNIPTVIPTRNTDSFDEEKQRTEKLERPERVERPERTDLSAMGAPPIGQPPLPSLMQSSNLVTIGGNQPPPAMNHYGYMPGLPFTHPQSPRNLEKPPQPQSEPQNLKIKQEVPDTNSIAAPPPPPPPPPPQSSSSGLIQPTSSAYMVSSPLPPHLPPTSMSDPLQSLKDVKVPGFSLPSAVTQQSNERPPSGPAVDNIKKEPEFGPPSTPRASPAQPPVEKSPALKSVTPVSSVAQTPPTNSPQPNSTNHSAINLISPSSSTQAPPTNHPFSSPMHAPPHSLMHHPFLAHAMHQFHSHPYSGYPFSYPYPYGPVPQPHAIPPPHQPPTSNATLKSTIESVSTTMLSSQHTTSSSLTAKREIREPDENGTERHQTHEMTLTHQQSTSHHSTVHASSEKHNYGGGANHHSITISHSTSSSSSQSVQHKVNQKTVRTSSPHTSVSQTSATASINHSTTSHQHTHHHTHHHERLSPSGQLLPMRHSVHSKLPQTNPHHLMIQPPSMGHHPTLGPPAMASSSLEQLRAHAAQAAANMQQNQSVHHTPTSSPMTATPLKPLTAGPPEEIKIEPDPETVAEEEPQNSPPGPPRGPSPEPRIEDTECHRSQSAM